MDLFRTCRDCTDKSKCLTCIRLAYTYVNPLINIDTIIKPDAVNHPKHYEFFPGVEAIEIIAASLTVEEFKGYCMGNRLKYRLRAGNKDALEQDIAKSDKYIELFNENKHLCRN